jgi:glycosyltransferase involved in cell wall biosynthesis
MSAPPRPRVTILTRAIAPLHPPGGLERAVYEQVRHLRRLGLSLVAVTQPPAAPASSPSDGGDRPRRWRLYPADASAGPPYPALAGAGLDGVAWAFVAYGDLPLRRNSVPDRLINYPLFVARAGRLLREQPRLAGDLVHAHGLLAAAAPPGAPLVYAPHGLEEFSRADWRKWLAYAPLRAALRRAARRAAAILATDSAIAPAVVAALRVPPARVRVVPNGIAVAGLDALADPACRAALRARLRLAEAPLRLVTCARLEANKGLHVALAALARARDALPAGWGWWVVGRGREEASLRRQVATLGLGGHVHLLGALTDAELHNLLPQMDLYLMPSLYEGSSLATLEAMSHGLPVLATMVGGLPDKVLPGRTGYAAPPGDAAALAAALRAALADRARWPALGQAGRALVRERFDWPAIARQLVALYDELLAGPGRP